MGEKRIRGLKARVGASAALAEEGLMGQIEQWRYISCRSPRRKSQCW